jgi:xanthine dehydrogenase YagT iron-sulfur-binding subunit
MASQKKSPPAHLSRRSFLSSLGAAGVVATAGPVLATAQTATPVASMAANSTSETVPGAIPVSLRVNGKQLDLQVDPRTTLLDCLRETISLTGTKKGCDHGQCGACTVHVNGRRINSCLTLAVMHEEDEITTIEGLGQPGSLHPVQASFLKHDGYQCGYCTSGQIMSAAALLKEKCGPSDADVKELMSGNICRCGAYPNIIAAIQDVRQQA